MLTDGPQRLDASGNSALEVEHNCFFPSHPAPLWGAQTGTCGLEKTDAGGDAGMCGHGSQEKWPWVS